MRKILQTLALIIFVSFHSLFAQPFYVFIDSWWGTGYQMYDDGTHGDATAGDGIYSLQKVVNLSYTGTRKWFIKNTTAGGNTGVVNHGYSWFYYPNSNTDVNILFTYNTNTSSTDWQPSNDIPHSNEPLSNVISIMLDGTQHQGVMKDDGKNGDVTAGDGIYTYKRTDLSSGTHTWYAYHKYDIKAMWSSEGKVYKDYINTEATITTSSNNQPVYFYVDVNTGKITTSINKNEEPTNDYKLVWSDEFNGDHLDPNKWRLGQHYLGTSGSGQAGYFGPNINVTNGNLVIKAEKRDVVYGGQNYSYASGVVSTFQEFKQKYGYFEARIKYDAVQGVWPAFWTMPDRGDYGNESNTRESFLKFDLSSFSGNINSAILKVKVSNISPTSGTGNITVHKLLSNTWDENSITWNNKPKYDPVWFTQLTYTTDPNLINQISVGKFIEIDVTNYINQQISSDGVAGFALIDNFMRTVNIKFNSKETSSSNDKPRLLVDGAILYPTDDAYVRGGNYADNNYGSETTIELEDSWGSTSSTYNGGMEIDIMESLGIWGNDVMQHAVHWDGYGADHKSDGSGKINITTSSDGYHIYAMDWRPGIIDFYVDGTKTWTFANERVGNIASYILLSNQIGGWDGNSVADNNNLPANIYVDYVRVYQKSNITDSYKDNIVDVDAPIEVKQGQHVKLTVNYEASTDRKIKSVFQLNQSPWTEYASNSKIVGKGNGTIDLFLDIPSDVALGNNYQFQTIITTTNGGWDERLDNLNKTPINVISGGSGSNQKFYVFIDSWWGTGYQMYDDGTHGDATAGDGIYSLQKVVNLSYTGTRKWFIKNTTAGGNTGVVNHGYSWFYYPNSNTDVNILFTYNTNTSSTDWQPSNDIPHSNEPLSNVISIMLDGTQHQGVMKDDGKNGDVTAGDGIYTYKRTDLSSGTHTWYAYHKYDIKAMWSSEGKVYKDYINTEATITTSSNNQPVYFYVDVNTGEVLAKLDTPLNKSVNKKKKTNNKLPLSYKLFQNYPNPFNPTTTIQYTIPNIEKTLHATSQQATSQLVQLKVYDVLGKEVATLVNKEQQPGTYEVIFNASDLPSGIYYYKLETNFKTKVKKMILIK